jgi:multidrug efflux pump subunit AcrB
MIMGVLAIARTPTDIFPNIDIPVISIIWNYNGLIPQDMSDRVVSVTERALTTTVDNIEHIESQSLYGVAVVKVFLQPTANVQQGIAQITAVSQTQLRQLPAGTTPPLILAYSASSVPVIQLALSGQNMSEQFVAHGQPLGLIYRDAPGNYIPETEHQGDESEWLCHRVHVSGVPMREVVVGEG